MDHDFNLCAAVGQDHDRSLSQGSAANEEDFEKLISLARHCAGPAASKGMDLEDAAIALASYLKQRQAAVVGFIRDMGGWDLVKIYRLHPLTPPMWPDGATFSPSDDAQLVLNKFAQLSAMQINT